MKREKYSFIALFFILVLFGCDDPFSLVGIHRPQIVKLGTIDCGMVETSPIVFNNQLYRFEYVRENYPDNDSGDSYFRIISTRTGEQISRFGQSWHLGSAFVYQDSVYVTAVNGWGGERIDLFTSADLQTWNQKKIIDLPGNTLYNTSLCRSDSLFVLMYEIGDPPEEAGARFTARFATSNNLSDWTVTPSECNFDKNRYTAPHALRYFNGYYYNFYLEAKRKNSYETYVVRSRDLIHWEASRVNPVLKADEADKQLASDKLTDSQKRMIAAATNSNNSDIDFCEFDGKVIIYYSWGNQKGTEFLASAFFEGSLDDFLLSWFEVR